MIEKDELRELARRLGNPLAATDDIPSLNDPSISPRSRGVADDREPRSTLDRKLRAVAERKPGMQ
jgi:hypothetical protein